MADRRWPPGRMHTITEAVGIGLALSARVDQRPGPQGFSVETGRWANMAWDQVEEGIQLPGRRVDRFGNDAERPGNIGI
ncbi:hypothetical protein [Phyllobacterium sp. SB3]|uniref:hypothetical protein n=1 Tax=Phyllobacterium sp. SB3 TaxID=3156073 RepID=UPI0032AFA8A5